MRGGPEGSLFFSYSVHSFFLSAPALLVQNVLGIPNVLGIRV
jgi:hypothetical protein